jgi:hypothetical protein
MQTKSVFLSLGFGEQLWMYMCLESAIELTGAQFYFILILGLTQPTGLIQFTQTRMGLWHTSIMSLVQLVQSAVFSS